MQKLKVPMEFFGKLIQLFGTLSAFDRESEANMHQIEFPPFLRLNCAQTPLLDIVKLPLVITTISVLYLTIKTDILSRILPQRNWLAKMKEISILTMFGDL